MVIVFIFLPPTCTSNLQYSTFPAASRAMTVMLFWTPVSISTGLGGEYSILLTATLSVNCTLGSLTNSFCFFVAINTLCFGQLTETGFSLSVW